MDFSNPPYRKKALKDMPKKETASGGGWQVLTQYNAYT